MASVVILLVDLVVAHSAFQGLAVVLIGLILLCIQQPEFAAIRLAALDAERRELFAELDQIQGREAEPRSEALILFVQRSWLGSSLVCGAGLLDEIADAIGGRRNDSKMMQINEL